MMRRQPLNAVEAAAVVVATATVGRLLVAVAGGGGGSLPAGETRTVALAAALAAVAARAPWPWIAGYAVLRRCPPRGNRPPWPAAVAVLAGALGLRWLMGLAAAAGSGGPGGGGVPAGGGPVAPAGAAVLPWPVALAAGLVLFQAWRRDGRLGRAAAVLLAATALLALAGPRLAGGPGAGTAGPAGPAGAGMPSGAVEAAAALYWLALGLFNSVYTARSRPEPVPVRAPAPGAPAPGPAPASFDPARVPVVISGFYGAGNAGDEAILASLLNLLRERGYRDLTVFSIRPEETARRHGVGSVYRGWRRDLVGKARALLRARIFISGGGGLLQDTTPTFLFRGPVPYYLLMAAWARLSGCWVLFLGQGVGPLRGRWARFLTRLVANHADVITVRDAGSLEVLEEVGVTRPPRYLTADFVFAAPPPDPDRARAVAAREGLDPQARRVVVSVRTWPGRERLYPELAAFLDRVLDRLPGAEVVLVPMEGELDRAAAEELAGYLARPGVRVLGVQDDPADLEALVAGSWLAVGMRLHFLLFAARAGVPVLALNYDPKVAGAMARLGMSRYVFEPDRVRAADLLAAFEELVARYGEVSGALRRAAAELAPPAAANLDYVDAAAARASGAI